MASAADGECASHMQHRQQAKGVVARMACGARVDTVGLTPSPPLPAPPQPTATHQLVFVHKLIAAHITGSQPYNRTPFQPLLVWGPDPSQTCHKVHCYEPGNSDPHVVGEAVCADRELRGAPRVDGLAAEAAREAARVPQPPHGRQVGAPHRLPTARTLGGVCEELPLAGLWGGCGGRGLCG